MHLHRLPLGRHQTAQIQPDISLIVLLPKVVRFQVRLWKICCIQDTPQPRIFKTSMSEFLCNSHLVWHPDWQLRRVTWRWPIGGCNTPHRSMAARKLTAASNLITFLPLVLCEGQTVHISLFVTHRDEVNTPCDRCSVPLAHTWNKLVKWSEMRWNILKKINVVFLTSRIFI